MRLNKHIYTDFTNRYKCQNQLKTLILAAYRFSKSNNMVNRFDELSLISKSIFKIGSAAKIKFFNRFYHLNRFETTT